MERRIRKNPKVTNKKATETLEKAIIKFGKLINYLKTFQKEERRMGYRVTPAYESMKHAKKGVIEIDKIFRFAGKQTKDFGAQPSDLYEHYKQALKRAKLAEEEALEAFAVLQDTEREYQEGFEEHFTSETYNDVMSVLEELDNLDSQGYKLPKKVRLHRNKAEELIDKAFDEARLSVYNPSRRKRALDFREKAFYHMERARELFRDRWK